MAMLDLFPPSKRDAVGRALAQLGPIGGIEPLAGGLSGAGVWQVRLEAGWVVLKIDKPPDGLNDPARQYACMGIASEVGAAPKLLFADAVAGVSLVERIEARPLPARRELLEAAAALLHRLHAAPAFPPLIDFPEGVAQLIVRLQGLDLVDPAALAPLLELWPRLRADCRWGEDGLVASHNDPNPRNLIWDGQRLWLIDWEAAFRNDPFVDLAIMANYMAPGPDDDAALLEAYLGRRPTAARLERLRSMRRLCRVYYGVVLINTAMGWRPPPGARRLEVAPLHEISAEIAAGRVTLAAPHERFAYGAAMLNRVLADRA